MSSGKLDQSLDQIMKDRKPTGGPRRNKGRLPNRKAGNKANTAIAAPTGGIAKSRPAKSVPQTNNNRPAATLTGDKKIAVTGLPEDVNEKLIKDFFGSTVAPVKHVIINYGPTGRSRGSATVLFYTSDAAAEATKLTGTKVDGKPLKIERLINSANVPALAAPKPLSERMSKPKSAVVEKAKPAGANAKDTNKGPKSGRNNGNNNKKSGRAGRPKPKTADELNAEMDDYWGDKATDSTAAAAQPAPATNNDGDVGMVDEIL